MQITAEALCQLLNGTLEGDARAVVDSVAKIEEGHSHSLSFLANPKYEEFLYTTESGIVLVSKDFKPSKPVRTTLVRVDDPYVAFTAILSEYVAQINNKSGIEEPSFIGENSEVGEGIYLGAFAYIGKNCRIGKNVKIYPNCVIGDNVEIGDNTILYPNVTVYLHCKIGANCILHSGVVVGSDGFGFAPQTDGSYAKIPQTGNVVIEDEVEIGANTCLDRATMGSTIVRKGAKLDNLVQIAHNVEVGENTVIAGATAVAGSTKLGKNMVVGGQVGIAGHIQLADGTKIAAQSGILSTIKEPGKNMMGSPAFEFKQYFKSQAVFRNLPELDKRVHDLQQELDALKVAMNENK
ncbi:MAG: UDP-3-O-(3-hydroxymyristoyl)glucosamine N-acyltransferase [Bacteroidetes bacterium]|nr:UDP-3-O-(3-hydroxymyristoyl)glucosamine N-acyltransferase [Bacteroidota bacterium]